MTIQKLEPKFKFNEEQINQLRQIAPEAFKDGFIDFDSLYNMLSEEFDEELSLGDESYGLYWHGKINAIKKAFTAPSGTLIPVINEGLNAETSRNILIEGDNLNCLKLLKKSYGGQIKLIYIDPPYNTGTDLVYDDDYAESYEEYLSRIGDIDAEGNLLTTNPKSGGRFHAKWLSMMYPRIKLSYELLKDDGFLLVHIDENEVTNLTLILNEIFGEENNVGQIVWDKRNPKGDARGIAYQHENILCYIKNKEFLISRSTIQRPKKNAPAILAKGQELFEKLGKKDFPNDVKQLIKKYKINESAFETSKIKFDLDLINKEFSDWIKKQDFSGGEKAYNKIDQKGNVFQTVSMAWPNKKQAPDEYFIPLTHPITGKECPIPEKGWRFPPSTIKELLDHGLIVFGEDETTQPRNKYLLKENMNENIPSVIPFGGSDEKLFSKWKIPFENPKPYKFSSELIQYFVEDGDTIMDFFAGSGTTGHAVFELVSQGKKLNFILIQIPELIKEKTLAYKAGFRNIIEITLKRLKLAARDYQGAKDIGFKYFKSSNSNFKKWSDYTGADTKQFENLLSKLESSLIEDWESENLINEILLIEGFPLDSRVESVPSFNKNHIQRISSDFCEHTLFVCLDVQIEPDTINSLSIDDNDIFICLDNAVSDQEKLRLDDKILIKTL
jgi:adenine-specific DNA-methyltransferase